MIVLRHALAGDRADWLEDDPTRPLDRHGLAQSYELIDMLAGHRVDRIWTSTYARCQQTIAPLAATRRLPVVDREWLAEDVSIDTVASGLADVPSGTLLCTHGENTLTLGELLAPRQHLGELDKGAAWVFEHDGGQLVDLTELPAPARFVAASS